MTFGKALACILCPPFAVRDKGCGTVLFVGVLWLCVWIPGSIAAFVIEREREPQIVDVYHHYERPRPRPRPEPTPQPRTRPRVYMRPSEKSQETPPEE